MRSDCPLVCIINQTLMRKLCLIESVFSKPLRRRPLLVELQPLNGEPIYTLLNVIIFTLKKFIQTDTMGSLKGRRKEMKIGSRARGMSKRIRRRGQAT